MTARHSPWSRTPSIDATPDPLTFTELRLGNMLRQHVPPPDNVFALAIGAGAIARIYSRENPHDSCASMAQALASIVIIADALAAAHGIDLGAAVRARFKPEPEEASP